MPERHRLLLVDNSNSFTKVAVSDGDRILQRRKLPTPAISDESLAKILRGWKFDRTVICSVVPEKLKTLICFLETSGPVLTLSAKLDLGIGIDYPKPATIGGDRLANAIAAAELYGAPAVVVDFGTAVTFDILSADRKYIGGVIAPGLEVMTDYLHQRTALLPKVTLSEPVSVIGRSTKEAMLAGAVHGYRGLISQILIEIRTELKAGRKLHIVATGGYADLIADRLPVLKNVNPDLTLEGLRIVARRNPIPTTTNQ